MAFGSEAKVKTRVELAQLAFSSQEYGVRFRLNIYQYHYYTSRTAVDQNRIDS